jgi:hypothetical protein
LGLFFLPFFFVVFFVGLFIGVVFFFILFKLSLEPMTIHGCFTQTFFYMDNKSSVLENLNCLSRDNSFFNWKASLFVEQSVPAQSRNKVETQFVPILFLDIWDEETPNAATLILFILSLLILKKIVIILSKYKKNALEKRILIEDVQFFSSI